MSDQEYVIGDQRPLRCQSCGEQIGLLWGDEPDPNVVVARCYRCAAVGEAEAILGDE